MSTQPTSEEIAELRRLAEAATPGPWMRSEDSVAQAGEAGTVCSIAQCRHATDYGSGRRQTLGYGQNEANAAYVAAANPTRILALLDQVDEIRNTAKSLTIQILAENGGEA